MKTYEIFYNWLVFCEERFPLFRNIIFILFFVWASSAAAFNYLFVKPILTYREALAFFIVFFIFLHQKIFYEIKDYKNNPAGDKRRPLARGLVSPVQAKRLSVILIALEIFLSFFIGRAAVIALVCAIFYSILVHMEFFIGKWLRRKMATYALARTLIFCWMSLFIFSTVTELDFWQMGKPYGLFVVSNWLIFSIFEFGSKNFAKTEEKEAIELYSRRFGSTRAAFNVILMVSAVAFTAKSLYAYFHLGILFLTAIYLLCAFTLVAAGLYAVHNNHFTAKFFRGICSFFVLFYNVIFVSGVLIRL